MTGGQRLTAALVLAAAFLLGGRGVALVFANHAWFAALGASSVWRDQAISTALLYGTALVIGTVFAWANMAGVRRSIVALIVPKRVGNVQFGEEIPSARLRVITLGMSVVLAGVATLALPSWTTLALWRSDVVFGELDPYLGLDLAHYVAWLPLEHAAYAWAIVLYAAVALLVVLLYSLTPGLRWSRTGVRATTHARRHVAVLGSVLLLLAAWGFRLAAFDLLINGSGPGGMLTYVDWKVLVPTDAIAAVFTLAAAVVLLGAAWMAQTGFALVTVSAVLLAAVLTQLVGPAIAAEHAADPENAPDEQPYADTRAIYTPRAFPPMPPSLAMRAAADSGMLARADHLSVPGAVLPPLVYPGARTPEVLRDPEHLLRAPRVGDGLDRLLNAWALQEPGLLSDAVPDSAAVVRRRDLRERVAALAPVFTQSRAIGIVPSATGVVWIVDLYVTSTSYPLSAAQPLGGRRITYDHHAATAYVNGGTGAVAIVPDSVPDPVARAWLDAHPGRYLANALPPEFTTPPPAAAPPVAAAQPDTLFRAHVTAIYDRMRAALDSGNLRSFGAAFDSLGRVVHGAARR